MFGNYFIKPYEITNDKYQEQQYPKKEITLNQDKVKKILQ